MDKQRIFLISLLTIISYVIILTWNKDYDQETITNNVTENKVAQPNNTQDIPKLVENTKTKITTNTEQKQSELTENHTNVITVKTDTLLVNIDLHGGDIIKVELPKYPLHKNTPNIPFTLLNNTNNIYIAQSGLIGTNGPDANPQGRPVYESEKNQYELKENDQTIKVKLKLSEKDANITKEFFFKKGSYEIQLNYYIENKQSVIWQGALFGQIKRDSSKDPSSTKATTVSSYVGAAFKTNDSLYKKITFKDIVKTEFKENTTGGWVAMLQHYFVSAWIPNPKEVNTFDTRYQAEGPYYIVGFTGPLINIAPNSTGTISANFYAGPKIQSLLKTISPGLELTVDYGWLWWLAQPIFWLMIHIQKVIGNWGFTIITLTIFVKLALFKLSAAGYRSMANMRRVAPELQRLKELYGDDRQKMQQAMMELYRKEKINPFGGCLPIIIQIPVFLALYWTLSESVELRQAPFILWINDLSTKDPYFILPALMGLTMFVQQKLSPPPSTDPMQARVMKLLPAVFTIFFLWFPSGLVLYWVVSNTLSILQQWVITRHIIGTENK